MPRVGRWIFWGILLFSPHVASAGHGKTAAIDAYCDQLRYDFANTPPYVFSGPDPWVQLDEVPATMPDEGLAFVYTVGVDIRRVFLRITDRNHDWAEDIDYFYRQDGTLAKRERHLLSNPANIELVVVSYYAERRLLKQKSHHHPITRGRTDSSRFNDPGAPTFWTVDELPFPEIDDVWKRLAGLRSKLSAYPSA